MATYRPQGYGVSPALKRARDPFRTKNAITGTLLVVFVVSVWAYSISAVKQDNFDDIDNVATDKRQRVQTAPVAAPKLVSPENATAAQRSLDEHLTSVKGSAAPFKALTPWLMQFRPSVLDRLAFARHSDGTLFVWGAPAIDNVGSIGDRKFVPWEENSRT